MLEPRVEEIAEAIHDAVKGSGVRLGNWSVAYLTGGGLAINRGGRDFLSAKLIALCVSCRAKPASSPALYIPACWVCWI